MPQKILFIDRDGTIIIEPPSDFQVDSLEKLAFVPKAISALRRIAEECDYRLVMVTNQDGLGTASFPEETFHPAHNKMLDTLKGEGVVFDEILIDRSFPHENKPTRKPATGLLTDYIEGAASGRYDLKNSFVIGDRMTDVQLAQNLGCKAIRIVPEETQSAATDSTVSAISVLTTNDWDEIYRFVKNPPDRMRTASVRRTTNETDIELTLTLPTATASISTSGSAFADESQTETSIHTGIGFFDHMLDQLARHSGCGLQLKVRGDLYIDEHHTIEDTALALGTAFREALGDKRGIERYGFYLLAMDEALAQVALDFSGRSYLVWDVAFQREKVGDFPTEMAQHFFHSFATTAQCTLNIRASADNDHHRIEAIFKGFARAIAMAIRRNPHSNAIPSTKGVL
jgi:imidazoleglycerol-phosphate dehydratase / histidinol-phosphatase